jgi:amino-acid N-acetyltransferase
MVHSHHDEGRRSPDGRGVRLRGAAPGDLDRARSLVSGLGLPVEGLGDQFLQGYVVAVTGDGALVGLGGVEVYGGDGLLRSVAVALSCQGSSIGRAIVEDRIEWARGRGLASLYLLTETAPGFFERLGFERVERASLPKAVQASSEFSRVCPDTAVAMALALG